ncbi:MAG: DUF5998 family protein [Antricoccus sp.]
MSTELPADLIAKINAAGYYPELVRDVLDIAVAAETVTAHLVQGETTFDGDTVRRHMSVIALTPTRLVFVHADDHPGDHPGEHPADDHPGALTANAVASSESVALHAIKSVGLTHVVTEPAAYRKGALGSELTLSISWGRLSEIDLEPVACPDPHCEADHGLAGSLRADDLVLRVSAVAEGADKLADAIAFARALTASTAR